MGAFLVLGVLALLILWMATGHWIAVAVVVAGAVGLLVFLRPRKPEPVRVEKYNQAATTRDQAEAARRRAERESERQVRKVRDAEVDAARQYLKQLRADESETRRGDL